MKRECFYVNPEGEAEKGTTDVKEENKNHKAENPFLDKSRRFIVDEKGDAEVKPTAEAVIERIRKRAEEGAVEKHLDEIIRKQEKNKRK